MFYKVCFYISNTPNTANSGTHCYYHWQPNSIKYCSSQVSTFQAKKHSYSPYTPLLQLVANPSYHFLIRFLLTPETTSGKSFHLHFTQSGNVTYFSHYKHHLIKMFSAFPKYSEHENCCSNRQMPYETK